MPSSTPRSLAFAIVALLGAAAAAAAAAEPAPATSRTQRAFRLPPAEPVPRGAAVIPQSVLDALEAAGGLVELDGVPLDDRTLVDLVLTEVRIVEPALRVEVASVRPDGGIASRAIPHPRVRAFRGVARGVAGSEVFLSIFEGSLGGFVRLPEGVRFLASPPRGAGRPMLAFDPARVPQQMLPLGDAFCGSDGLTHPDRPETEAAEGGVASESCRVVSIAIETDLEFTANIFGGNATAAAAYALALTAASSEVFELDLGVRMRVDYLRLWEGGDPWDQTGTGNQLVQFRDHWQSLMQAVPRDLAHFYSGRPLGGGVAWLPGLCGSFNYALSANLNGFFPYPITDYSNANWDLMVVAHEFGHNFGAPHTHQVNPPIDGCGNGDCSVGGIGTIMSYCHTCPGGLANVAMRFHPGSVASMQALLASISCSYSGGPDPVAASDLATGLAGTAIEIDVLANDLGGDCSLPVLASADASTSLGFPITEVAGPSGRPRLRVSPPSPLAGPDSFAYAITDEFGGLASGSVSIDWRPIRPAVPVVGAMPGVVAGYFVIPESSVLPNFSTLSAYASEIVPRIDFPSTSGNFAGSGRADLVAAAFEGWLEVPVSGMWTLFTDSDDGSRLWIGETLVVENDGLHPMVERSGQIGLAAGRHPARVEFFENFGGAGLIVRAEGPGTTKQTVPAAWWSHGGTARPGDLDQNGVVDGSDLALLLSAWGPCSGCRADLDGSGAVDGADLAILLANWG